MVRPLCLGNNSSADTFKKTASTIVLVLQDLPEMHQINTHQTIRISVRLSSADFDATFDVIINLDSLAGKEVDMVIAMVTLTVGVAVSYP